MTLPRKFLAPALLLTLSFIAAPGAFGASSHSTEKAIPPGYSTTITGNLHDFDYFMGSGWITHQHRMKTTDDGKQTTDNFKGYLCAVPYLGNTATVDELYFPIKGSAGLTLRLFNPKTRQWSIYWASSTNGVLNPNPVVGGFKGKLGLFYGTDTDAKGHPIKVRFIWKYIDHDHARWEQAISHDGREWVTNWTADFMRADRAKVCDRNGVPKR